MLESVAVGVEEEERRKNGREGNCRVIPYHSVIIKFVMRQQLLLGKREVARQELAHTMSVSRLQAGEYPRQRWERCDESSLLVSRLRMRVDIEAWGFLYPRDALWKSTLVSIHWSLLKKQN